MSIVCADITTGFNPSDIGILIATGVVRPAQSYSLYCFNPSDIGILIATRRREDENSRGSSVSILVI